MSGVLLSLAWSGLGTAYCVRTVVTLHDGLPRLMDLDEGTLPTLRTEMA